MDEITKISNEIWNLVEFVNETATDALLNQEEEAAEAYAVVFNRLTTIIETNQIKDTRHVQL